MYRPLARASLFAVLVAVCLTTSLIAGEKSAPAAEKDATIKLPPPETTGGMPLMEALRNRQTRRSYSEKPLPPQMLSNLLWAAAGVNRPREQLRTAPTARNWQEIDIYVARKDGLFRFDPANHALLRTGTDDLRAQTGLQPFVADAPVNLIYVCDRSRMRGAAEKDKDFYAATDTGFVSQNVYLFCASEGLATVVRGLVDRDALAEAMGLANDERVVLCQTVGYPGK